MYFQLPYTNLVTFNKEKNTNLVHADYMYTNWLKFCDVHRSITSAIRRRKCQGWHKLHISRWEQGTPGILHQDPVRYTWPKGHFLVLLLRRNVGAVFQHRGWMPGKLLFLQSPVPAEAVTTSSWFSSDGNSSLPKLKCHRQVILSVS